MYKSAKFSSETPRRQIKSAARLALRIDRRNMLFAFWIAIACAAIILIAFAIISGRVSSGWRLFVLGHIFRAVWAATIGVIAGTIALLILGALAPPSRHGVSVGRAIFTVLRIIIAFLTAIGALGYFMPDWTRLSAATAAIVILIWILAGLTALGMRAAQ